MRLQDQYAVITGGASGFGLATALRFAQEGAHVAICDLNHAQAQEAVRQVEALGRKALAIAMDVSKEAEVHAGFTQILTAFPQVDILVNCAGLGRSTPIQDLTLEQWNFLLNVNCTGTFLCCREIIPHMIARQHGKIINTASICAQTGRQVAADYAASKSGVVGITRALALQVAPDGINVNAVAPGPVVTPLFAKNYPPETVEGLLRTVPFKRQGTPEDIANLNLFLASEESGWITGEVISVNGGAFIG